MTSARRTLRAFVPTSLEVMPPLAITKAGVTPSPATSDCTASDIRTERSRALYLVSPSSVSTARFV